MGHLMQGGRDKAASAAQYLLLGGFAAVASGVSSQGLTGFARSSMALAGPWPYLLFFALDGAAGVCAVLLARRAARAGGSAAPRLAVWGLVAASAAFNAAHAPRHPGAPEAYALMPVIAAVLFEFCLQETRSTRAGRPGRRLSALGWLHPAERVRIRLRMAADETLPASEAVRRVRIESAAKSLYRLRTVLHPQDRAADDPLASRRAGRALRRAHAALTRAGFTDAATAAEVLRHVQILTMTAALAALDYASPDAARTAIGALITPGDPPGSGQASSPAQPAGPGSIGAGVAACCGCPPAPDAGQNIPALTDAALATVDSPAPEPLPPGSLDSPAGRDGQLIEAAQRIADAAAHDGARLSQAALASKLRSEGWTIANDRLRWLTQAAGLSAHHG
jgi:hypothetical protein